MLNRFLRLALLDNAEEIGKLGTSSLSECFPQELSQKCALGERERSKKGPDSKVPASLGMASAISTACTNCSSQRETNKQERRDPLQSKSWRKPSIFDVVQKPYGPYVSAAAVLTDIA